MNNVSSFIGREINFFSGCDEIREKREKKFFLLCVMENFKNYVKLSQTSTFKFF
jgi:hypothetical protein